ncbi:MAG: methyl-accepting chemotaxis protein [Methanococcaceae archaeon]
MAIKRYAPAFVYLLINVLILLIFNNPIALKVSFSILTIIGVLLFVYFSSVNNKNLLKQEDLDAIIIQADKSPYYENGSNEIINKIGAAFSRKTEEVMHLRLETTRLENLYNAQQKSNLLLKEKSDFCEHVDKQSKYSFVKIGQAIQYALKTFETNIGFSTSVDENIKIIASSVDEQFQESECIASAIEEMTQTLVQNSDNTQSVLRLSIEARERSLSGVSIAQNVKQGISRVEAKAKVTREKVQGLVSEMKQIGEVALIISDIADQTNLLALNAAIEAARAGEQGRGFAVVADEVRKLAERTTKATKEIGTIVRSIQTEVDNVGTLMNEVNQEVKMEFNYSEELTRSLAQIESQAVKISDFINQIAGSSEEQTATMESISQSVHEMRNHNENSAKTARNIALETENSRNHASGNYDKLLISVAKSDHINWVNNIVESIVKEKQVDSNSITNHLNCRFGLWYNSEAKKRYGSLKVFKEIEPVHIEVHRKGKELIEHCQNKETNETKKCISEIEDLRDRILLYLDQLENAV